MVAAMPDSIRALSPRRKPRPVDPNVDLCARRTGLGYWYAGRPDLAAAAWLHLAELKSDAAGLRLAEEGQKILRTNGVPAYASGGSNTWLLFRIAVTTHTHCSRRVAGLCRQSASRSGNRQSHGAQPRPGRHSGWRGPCFKTYTVQMYSFRSIPAMAYNPGRWGRWQEISRPRIGNIQRNSFTQLCGFEIPERIVKQPFEAVECPGDSLGIADSSPDRYRSSAVG